MFTHLHQLLKLPVFTTSGQKVGVVYDLEIDVDTHSVRHYIVSHRMLGKEQFWVAPMQVRSITADKMIVDDTILTDPALKVTKTGQSVSPQVDGAVTRTIF